MSFISFLDSVETLPAEIKRSFDLVTHLDHRCKGIMDRINQRTIAHKQTHSKRKRNEIEEETKALFDKLDELAKDKFKTIDVAYDLIDKNIGRLNSLADDVPLNMEKTQYEPTYCICHEVSYGEMIKCENAECHIEWFHMTCVGLTKAPKKWYCSECMKTAIKIKRRSRKR